jgi:signal transduction histidine kinase
MGIGTYESREYIHQLGGRIEVTSCEAIGTSFRVIVRLYSAQAIAGYVSKEAL